MDLARVGIIADSSSVPIATRNLKDLRGESRKVEASNNALAKSSSGLGAAMGRATLQIAGVASAMVAVRTAFGAADTYANIQNRLLALGVSYESVTEQIDALAGVANRTRTPLESIASLYSRLQISADSLGASQQEMLKFTENVGLALSSSGTSASEASGALTQLSQALAGGVVRAEEFNSILEGAPGIMIAAAKGIEGVEGDIGKLRKMMLDGEVTSRTFFDALLSQSEALEEAFANTVPTISQAMTVLNNSFLSFVGQADQSLGVSTAVAEAMLLLADNIERVAFYAGTAAVAFGGAYVAGIALAAARTATLTGALTFLRAAIIRTGIGALIVGAGEMVYQFSRLVKGAGGFGEAMVLLGGVAVGVWDKIVAGGQYVKAQLGVAFNGIAYNWVVLVNQMQEAWAKFQDSVAGSSIGGMLGIEGGNYNRVILEGTTQLEGLTDQLVNLIDSASEAREAMLGPTAGVQELKDAVSATVTEIDAGSASTTKFNKALEGTEGAGKKAAAGTQSAIDKLKLQIQQERELIGLSGDAVRELEARHRVEAALAQDKIKWNEEAIQGLADQITMNEKLKEASQQTSEVLKDVFDGIASGDIGSIGSNLLSKAQSSFSGLLQGAFSGTGNFFTGIATGFKDAIGGISSALSNGVGIFGKLGGAVSAAMPIIGAISTAISFFKTTTTELDAGLRVTTQGMDALVETFKTVNKVKFFGLSNKTSTDYDTAELSLSDPIQDAINAIGDTVTSLSDTIGLASDNIANTSFEFELSTKGKTDEEIQSAIQTELSRLGDAFAGAVIGSYSQFLPDEAEIARIDSELNRFNSLNTSGGRGDGQYDYRIAQLEEQRLAAETAIEVTHLNGALSELQLEGEGSLDMLTRIVSELSGANSALSLLDQELISIDQAGTVAASKLVQLAGGLEAFTAKSQFVFDNLLTGSAQEARLTEIALDSLNGTFGALTLAIPETHSQFMALLNVQDLTTSAGRETYAALQDVAAAFVQVNGTATEAAAAMQADIDAASTVLSNRASLAESALSDAETALRAAFGAERDRVSAAYALQITAAEEMAVAATAQAQAAADTAQERVTLYQSMVDALERAYSDRRVLDAIGQQSQLSNATGFLRNAVSSGGTSDLDALERALDVVADPSSDLFKSFEDYRFDYAVNTALIEKLRSIQGATLTIEERALRAAESQINAISVTSGLQVLAIEAARDAEISALDTQLDALLGIDSSILTLADAISQYIGAQASVQRSALPETVAETEFAAGSFAAELDSIYQDLLGRAVGTAGLDFYGGLFDPDNGFGFNDIRSDILGSDERERYKAAQASNSSTADPNAQLVSEIQLLRASNERTEGLLSNISTDTRRNADVAEEQLQDT